MLHPSDVTILHPSMHFTGGAERLTTTLALGLADGETNVRLVTGLCNDTWRRELRSNTSVSLRELGQIVPGTLKFWLNVKRFTRAFSKLIDPETEVIVTSSFPSSIAAHIFAKEHNVRIAHYLHEAPQVLHDREGLKTLPFRLRLFYRMMSALHAKQDIEAVQRSSIIVANSQLTKKANSSAYGVDESRIEVVYPGVSPERVALLASVPRLIAKQVTEGIPVIFIPRGARFWRNPETCLEAFHMLRTESFIAVFTGGSNHEVDYLIQRVKTLNIEDKVVWARELPNEELRALYSHSSMVISIPRRQPFGLIPLEALLHGAPPIISRTSGVSEVLADGVDAICVNESNPQELADAIQTLSNDEVRRKIVSSGRRTVLTQLTSTRFVKEIRDRLMS